MCWFPRIYLVSIAIDNICRQYAPNSTNASIYHFSTIENLSILRYIVAILTKHHLINSANDIKILLDRAKALLNRMENESVRLGDDAFRNCIRKNSVDGNYGYRGVALASLHVRLGRGLCENWKLSDNRTVQFLWVIS